MSTHCQARTKAGKPCKAVAVGGDFCAFHADPKRAAQLGRIGGRKNRRYALRYEASPVRPPQTAREVKDLLAEALAGIHVGRLEPKIGSVMAYVGSALLKAIKTTDIEERIAALERSTQKE
jgi:hypothetical protein